MSVIDNPQSTTATGARTAHLLNGHQRAPLSPPTEQAYAPEAWFLGPLGENADEVERLVVEALRDHVFWRRNFHPGDHSPISEASKRSPQYLRATDTLKHSYRSLLAILKKSVPFFSERYQGHMAVDLAIPSLLGYFAAMLYNPNNVAFEGSTATTLLEILVGDDLCRMLGYTVEPAAQSTLPRPWGHITSGGTVANIEALWSARNLKFYPLALQAALQQEATLAAARDLMVDSAMGTTVRLRDADLWTLLNLRGDDILALPERLQREMGIPAATVNAAVNNYSLQTLGMGEFARRFLADLTHAPVFFVPGTKHYSFPKAAALLGIGAANMIDVAVDLAARMDLAALRRHLTRCLAERWPVYTVVTVMGSTEESAVDPLAEVLALREEFRRQGLEFTIHADAAWGGYHTTLLRADEVGENSGADPVVDLPGAPSLALSAYVTRQLGALAQADSITVDPHKGGYMPYPAGALCYRNSAMRALVTFDAPYMYHGEAEPTVGIYGIEGSKPGAAAATVYLSHRCIPPSRQGYGRIIEQATWRCKLFYARLLTMARPEDPFIIVPLMRLPAEVTQQDVEAQLRLIRTHIDRRPIDEILADREVCTLLAELGPDLNILAYAFNFKTMRETVNSNLALANRLNQTLYQRFSIKPRDDIYGYNLIVSTTDLDAAHYGTDFIADYKRRLGVENSPGESITVLRSVVMDPWSMATTGSVFLDLIEAEFRAALQEWARDRNSHLVEGWFAGKRST